VEIGLSLTKPIIKQKYALLHHKTHVDTMRQLNNVYVRFQDITAASMMFRAVVWVVLPC